MKPSIYFILLLSMTVAFAGDLKWDQNNDFQPWRACWRLKCSRNNGVLELTDIGKDSSIVANGVNVDPAKFNRLSIRYRATGIASKTTGQLYFAGGNRPKGGLLEDNTQRMTEAIRKNRPLVVTHPGDKSPVDIEEVARACETTGTWMEINNFHKDLTVENLKRAAKYDVKFVIGSDAHKPERVGCFEEGLQRLLDAGVDPQRVVNLKRK